MGKRIRKNDIHNIVQKLKNIKFGKKEIIIAICILLIFVIFIAKVFSGKKSVETISQSTETSVTRGDVEVAITGSAAVEPNERYEIISMVSGDIVSSGFEVGDTVNEGDILYQFDTSSTDIGMEKQRLSLEQSKMNYENALKKKEDLLVTASSAGVISGLDIDTGDDISAGAFIADINNTRKMKVILPFNQSQVNSISKGDFAEITSSQNMAVMSGEVVGVASVANPQSDGSMLYDVEIEFENPGSIVEGQVVGGAVNGMISPGAGNVSCSKKSKVVSEAEGTVQKVYSKNGDYVEKGEAILLISSDTVQNNLKSSSISYRNAELSLKEQEEKLEDYSITSPINGTVITKNSKAGDTIDKTNSSTILMVVADVSKLKFELEIDELDVNKVKQGQSVEITCDALPREVYYGMISNVSVEGVAANGVTTYSAEVIIEEPGNLRPSMNVDASVIVERAENVLRVPTSDIKTAMNRSFVFVKDEDAKNKDSKEKKEVEENKKSEKNIESKKNAMPSAPDGYKTVEITIGIKGEDFTEVKSGVDEGDIIYSQIVSSSGMRGMFGGMGAMMGGAPGGMMGGAPGGMMGR